MSDEAFREMAAAAVERDARQIVARVDGGDVQVWLFAEPDANLGNAKRVHLLVDLALAELRERARG